MMRKTPASSMQKTYDECYLICSTAIYFEGQNNEAEALRSWRNALDQIYYHNAYKIPAGYAPRSETEKALHDSLRAMELQCKERVDLLEALKKSRLEAEEDAKSVGNESKESLASTIKTTGDRNEQTSSPWLGSDTVPPTTYADLPRPPLPDRRPVNHFTRPSYKSKKSSTDKLPQPEKPQRISSPALAAPTPESPKTRTPSPDKKAGGMLRTLRSNPKDRSSGKMASSLRNRPPTAAAKAATQVWSGHPRPFPQANGGSTPSASGTTWDPYTRSLVDRTHARDSVALPDSRRSSGLGIIRPPSPTDYMNTRRSVGSSDDFGRGSYLAPPYPDYPVLDSLSENPFSSFDYDPSDSVKAEPPPPPPHRMPAVSPIPLQPSVAAPPPPSSEKLKAPSSAARPGIAPSSLSYMKEYPNHPPNPKNSPAPPAKSSDRAADTDRPTKPKVPPAVPRKAVSRAAGVASATLERQKLDQMQSVLRDRMKTDPNPQQNDDLSSSPDLVPQNTSKRRVVGKSSQAVTPPTTDDSPDSENPESSTARQAWEGRVQRIMKKLPKGVDETAAKQIFNEIVIKGDEVHWDDVAGLEIAKSALKETVVYPFLRPDLFMGLREPARGMLLFGPPGTGKTMLARAVATESKSVFFAISASSLTSKFLGESEKLVRALFALAKELAPSIIFVDEIDSLLGSRGGSSEHEATRRIKTEFLIQWSDLQKAAAGRNDPDSKGDATRVLVLAATNLPWAIDEAARRRFVRRQYIPLPEDWVREKQLRNLLSAQKHSLKDRQLKVLVQLTDGFSGSDITALAKDAAMGPLRSLGEQLLHMSPDDIRPIGIEDFEASLVNIRPSVSKQGLKEFEDWAKEFGERGG